jgi:hypothetical protein
MPLITNLGGSITGAITLVAILAQLWLVARQRRRKVHTSQQAPALAPPRHLGLLSPAALRLLVRGARARRDVVDLVAIALRCSLVARRLRPDPCRTSYST